MMTIFRGFALGALVLAMAGCASPQKYAMQWNAERHACASVGLDPATDQFAQCVADLDSNVTQSQQEHQR